MSRQHKEWYDSSSWSSWYSIWFTLLVSRCPSLSSTQFAQASAFNGNISSWNVSSITDMSAMFLEASTFNVDLSRWAPTSLKNAESMFLFASSFQQNLCSWAKRVPSKATVSGIFSASGCNNTEDPVLQKNEQGNFIWSGPWCQNCDQFVSLAPWP